METERRKPKQDKSFKEIKKIQKKKKERSHEEKQFWGRGRK